MKIFNSSNEKFNNYKKVRVEINFKGINNPLEVSNEALTMKTSNISNVEIRNGIITFETENGSWYSFEL